MYTLGPKVKRTLKIYILDNIAPDKPKHWTQPNKLLEYI